MFPVVIDWEAMPAACGCCVRTLCGSKHVSIVNDQKYFWRKWGQCPGYHLIPSEGSNHLQTIISLVLKISLGGRREERCNG